MFKLGVFNKIFIKQLKNLNFKIKKFLFFPKFRKKNEKRISRKINSLSKYDNFTKIEFLNFL